jgi:hypothetical protein
MGRKNEHQNENTTLDKIMRVEHRIHGTKGDIEGLFENYVSDLILLRELRATLAAEMVDNAFPQSPDDKTTTVCEDFNVE